MRAVSRLGRLLLAAGLALAPWAALAQQAPPPSDAPAADTIGPKELQNFSLKGTVTHSADQPAAVAPAEPGRQARTHARSTPPAPAPIEAAGTGSVTALPPAPQRTETASAAHSPQPRVERAPEPLRQSPAASSVTAALPNLGGGAGTGSAAAPAPATDFAPEPTTGTLAPEHSFPILPWLLAALALVLGGGFLFWRSRAAEAFAGGPKVDPFVAPAPPVRAPAPPAPAPKPAAPAPSGIVSTRLRPWVEIGFQPLRCVLEDERVTFEFELELFNSGSAPARGVLIEASFFNAGAAQDQEIGAFFASPVAEGERIAAIPPLKRIALKTQVVAPREQVQAYELAGHQVFVPLIAFNALYSWSGGEGQTSAGFLLGRDTKSDRVGPFRLDLGPRIFRTVAARLLPSGVRR